MFNVIVWWAVVTLLGMIAFPYLYPLLKNLPDRGYSIAKTFGILALSYSLWLSVTFGLLPNSRGSILLIAYLLALGSLYLLSRHRRGILESIRQNRRLLIAEEAVFAIAFLILVLLRAFNPQIEATEKPMDFAFLNSSIRSPSFPPLDPWLSGHTISYYYMGYLVFGSIIQLTAIPPSVGYNLSIGLIFALSASGIFGIVYNLIRIASSESTRHVHRAIPYLAGMTGVIIVLVAGNLEVIFELARAHGAGSPDFWKWLGVKELNSPYLSQHWYPTDNWWWWRATRVIGTVEGDTALDVTITEFPFFSFLLGDLHPHVMALPLAVASVALAADLFNKDRPTSLWPMREKLPYIFMAAVLIGSFGALNAWDLPTYLGFFLLAGLVSHLRYYGHHPRRKLLGFVLWSATLVALAAILYSPFYLTTGAGLYSTLGPDDAKGGLPMALWNGPFSRPAHIFIFWGFFLFITMSLIVAAVLSSKGAKWLPIPMVLLPVFALIPVEFVISQKGNVSPSYLVEIVQRWWPLFPALVSGVVLFSRMTARRQSPAMPPEEMRSRAMDFAILMALVGLLLIAVCETVFIRDVFRNRMNTIFKFYYQAWLFLGLASTFTIYYFCYNWRGKGVWQRASKTGWMTAVAALFILTILYPMASVIDKTSNFKGSATLDGTAFVQRVDPYEAEAIAWLQKQETNGLVLSASLSSSTTRGQGPPVVLEANGDQYSSYGRVSSRTGFPTVLGWYGHELQWRGNDAGFRDRPKDIEAMYTTEDKRQVMDIFKKYEVAYVFVGSLERSKYPRGIAGFQSYMDIAFQNPGVTIYRVPE